MRKATCLFILAVLLLCCAVFSLTWLIPVYVNKRLVPDLKNRYDLPGLSLTVRHLGFDGMIVEALALTDTGGRGLHADSLSCRYTLFDLIGNREVEKCIIRGVRVDLAEAEGRISLAGLEPLFAAKVERPGEKEERQTSWQLPVTVKSLVLENAHLVLQRDSGTMDIPLSLSVALDRPLSSSSKLPFRLQVEPLAQNAIVQGSVDLASRRVTLQYDVQLDFASLPMLMDLAPLEQIGGTAHLAGEFAGSYAPFVINRLASKESRVSFQGGFGDWRIGTPPLDDGSSPPVDLNLQPDGSLSLVLPDLQINGPVVMAVRVIDLRLSPGADQLTGTLTLSPTAPVALGTKGALQVGGEFNVIFLYDLKAATWKFTAASSSSDNENKAVWSLRAAERANIAAPLAVELSGSGSSDSAAIHCTCSMPTITMTADRIRGRAEGGICKINGTLRKEKAMILADLDYSVELPLVSLSAEDGLQGRGGFAISGRAGFDGRAMAIDGRLLLENGVVELAEQQLAVNGISGDIPFSLPWGKDGKRGSGRITADAVNWQGKELASLDVQLAGQGTGYDLAGEISGKALDGARIKVSGRADAVTADGGPAFDGTLRLDKHRLDKLSLQKIGLAQPVYVSGQFLVDAHAAFKRGDFSAEATFGVEEGEIELSDKGITLRGVNTALSFNHLPSLRSLPARLRFSSFKTGEYVFGDGVVGFQFESDDTLLVEKGRFKWCGGTVQAMAMRLPLRGGAFAADLYCDRLNLAELLRQFGIKDAGGNGTVNGHIPLSFGNGKFTFEDGFLYSTPGGGGTIKVKALDLLTAGVPKNSPQFAQLDFAASALSDFSYNWVKLSLVSEGEDVMLRMNLDGKPTKPLPFYYDQKSGTFNRLEISSEKGISQQIVLDVNFRIPFNELLGYGKSIKQVIDLMQ